MAPSTSAPLETFPITNHRRPTEQVIEDFGKKYGNYAASRTRKQWKALVKTFGYNKVMAEEGLTKRQVKEKCKD